MAINQDDLNRLQQYVELQEHSAKSLENLRDTYGAINELKRNLKKFQKDEAKFVEKIRKKKQEIRDLDPTAADYAKRKKELKAEVKYAKEDLDLTRRKLRETEKLKEEMADVVNLKQVGLATLRSTGNVMKSMVKTLYQQKGYLFEQQKALKMAQLQMGLIHDHSKGFADNLYQASTISNKLGTSAKDLAQMQATYSNQIGKSVELSEAGLLAMSELAEGTILGNENAARFAANMENFGVAAEASRDFMEDSLNIARKFGLNAAETTENIQKALQIANNYNFKNGVRGIKDMAFYATKFKINMDSVAGMAETAFNPEGAIEMASKLSVLGGAWAQLGDPFQLMFKARNDLSGFTKDIVNAAAGQAQFNKATGEVDIESMELHRLREVAKATGLNFEDLNKQAREFAKHSAMKADITGNFDEDTINFITSKGQWNDETKKFKLEINGASYALDELHKVQDTIKALSKKEVSLEKAAMDSKTFDETWDNVINQFKSTLLPGFRALTTSMTEGLNTFQSWMEEHDILTHLSNFGKVVGEVGAEIAKFVVKNPIISALGLLLGSTAKWVARGYSLGMGFNKATGKGLFGGSGKNGGGGIGGKWNSLSKAGKWRAGGGLGAAAGIGMDVGRNFLDEPDGDVGKAMGVLARGLQYGGMGAMIGGPWGAAIGAAAGLAHGAYDEYFSDEANNSQSITSRGYGNQVAQDFVSRPGEEPIKFSSADTLIGMKKGGGIDNFLSKKKNTATGGAMSISFSQPLKIEGSIKLLGSNGNATTIDLNNPILKRELSHMVQEQLTKAINGKTNQNPV